MINVILEPAAETDKAEMFKPLTITTVKLVTWAGLGIIDDMVKIHRPKLITDR